MKSVERWGAKWRSGQPETRDEHLIYENCLPVLFLTKKEAAQWIKKRYGYIATRKDLRGTPHFWRMPIPIRVTITAKQSNSKTPNGP